MKWRIILWSPSIAQICTTTRFNVETQTELTHRCVCCSSEKKRNISNVNSQWKMWKVVELLLENIGAHVDCLESMLSFQLFFFSSTTCLQFPLAPHITFFIQFNIDAFGYIMKRWCYQWERVDVDCLAIYAFSTLVRHLLPKPFFTTHLTPSRSLRTYKKNWSIFWHLLKSA